MLDIPPLVPYSCSDQWQEVDIGQSTKFAYNLHPMIYIKTHTNLKSIPPLGAKIIATKFKDKVIPLY